MKSIIFIWGILISVTLSSQENEYKVFFYGGDVYFKQQQQWLRFNSINYIFTNNDSISLGDESFLYLVDKENMQFFIDQSGKHKIDGAIEYIKKQGSSSLLGRYSKFIWDELNKPNEDIEEYADQYLKDKGGVSRAMNIPQIISPFYNTHILRDEILFKWENSGAQKYTLSFWDSDYEGRRLFSLTISDTVFSLQLDQDWIPRNRTLFWSVSENKKPATNFIPFMVLGEEEKERIHETVEGMNTEFQGPEEIKLLMLAAFYEENNLYQLARDSYRLASSLDPDNQAIEEYYRLFMARMGDY